MNSLMTKSLGQLQILVLLLTHGTPSSQVEPWRAGNAIHPKLRNINPHNVTHSLISWNPRERMFVVQIPLLTVTFLFLIS